MAHFLDDVITALISSLVDIANDLESLDYNLYWAGANLKDENFDTAGAYLQNAATNVGSIEQELCVSSSGFGMQTRQGFKLIRTNWPTDGEPYVLTWKKICEAWSENDFEGRAVTIAFIDRMRQLIWDEPFYAVWASRPEEQEF